MSAFILDSKSLSRFVENLSKKIFSEHYYGITTEWKKALFTVINFTEGKKDFCEKLFSEMESLNVMAVNIRYNEKNESSNRFVKTNEDVSDIQLYKTLKCWLYQCREGNIPELSSLYTLMKMLENDLKDWIIFNLTEYKESVWG